jgi:GDPmannose 4,6-dehydratase
VKKRALKTGITGQDGAYLAKFLLEQDYEVYGLRRRTSLPNEDRLSYLGVFDHVRLLEGEILDESSVMTAVRAVEPHEVYNLAAQSFVGASWRQPLLTAQSTGVGAVNVLEAVRLLRPNARVYQASSSEMFGLVTDRTQSETTKFYPRSPYAAAKLFVHWMTINYRESYRMFACAASCSITSRRFGAWNSSRARLPMAWPASSWGYSRSSYWGISMPSETGDLPATM